MVDTPPGPESLSHWDENQLGQFLTLRQGPPAASTGKFTVRLLHAMSQPLRVDFFHRPRAKMAVALFPACQRCWPGEIGPIGDDMRKR